MARVSSRPFTKKYAPVLPGNDQAVADVFGDRDLPYITTDDIQGFLTQYTAGFSNTTKKARFSLVNAFFNFVRDNLDHTVQNPCDTKELKRQFRPSVNRTWKIIERTSLTK